MCVSLIFFFFNDTATTEIYTLHIVGSVRCVQETAIYFDFDQQAKRQVELQMDNGYSIEQFNDEMKNQQLFQYDESNDYMNNMFVVTSNKEFPQGLTLQQQQSNLQVEHVEQQNVIGEIQNQQVQLQQSQQVNQQQQNNVDQDDKNENLSIDSSYQSSNFMNHISNQEQSSRDKQSTNDESLVTSGQNEEFNTASKKIQRKYNQKVYKQGKEV
eukprot:TRINITY_DN35189_c0_g1_i3.p2 TRINITY_DN35189_c0_g1~~TRINITY_DN35189_c0_g1_i3.p2  ORF type:complete len:213 (+),score=56.83 TRINITY_DN35189_c0_g1_i3:89-727(+)